MADTEGQLELTSASGGNGNSISVKPLHLRVTFNHGGRDRFRVGAGSGTDRGARLAGAERLRLRPYVLDWRMESHGKPQNNFCSAHASSVRAMLNRIRKFFPLAEELPSTL